MVRPLIKAQVTSVGLGVIAPFLHGWPEWILWRGGEWLSWGSILGFGVVLVWNVLYPDLEARAEREAVLEEAREHKRQIMQRAAVGALTGWDRAVMDAQRAGTFSLNGVRQPGTTLRYAGPPPLYTPPRGLDVMITVELRAEPVILHRDATWVFPGGRPAGLGHGCLLRNAAPCADGSSCRCREHGYVRRACDGCGKPLLVSNPLPGTSYTCAACG